MKTTQQLKQQIFQEVETSGFYRNVQAQVKAHVLDIIENQTMTSKNRLGFQYEHPLLNKLRKYPQTSQCMDLIQQFLESFKFKHTLNVFKKEINRNIEINRSNLSKQFSLDLSGKSQAVLLSIVGQLSNGQIKIIDKPTPSTRKNNFMNEQSLKVPTKEPAKKETLYYDLGEKKQSDTKVESEKDKKKGQTIQEEKKQSSKRDDKQENSQSIEEQKQSQKPEAKSKQKKKQEKKEGATDLLEDVMIKFKFDKNEKKKEIDEEAINQRKAYSEEKKKKELVPEQSGANKIRGISAGKIGGNMGGSLNSFMKFSSFNQPPKNESQMEEQFDQLQQSRDSTRRNPLFSSSESGFDKSLGYDQSVDSMAIDDYEYVEKARKFNRKY